MPHDPHIGFRNLASAGINNSEPAFPASSQSGHATNCHNGCFATERKTHAFFPSAHLNPRHNWLTHLCILRPSARPFRKEQLQRGMFRHGNQFEHACGRVCYRAWLYLGNSPAGLEVCQQPPPLVGSVRMLANLI